MYTSVLMILLLGNAASGLDSWWTNWSECSVTCGNGVRTRKLITELQCPVLYFFETPCHQYEICETGVSCLAVNGNWGYWGSWGGCSGTCGDGSQTRTRQCNNPAPSNGGSDCGGSGTESQSCNTGVTCPAVNGNFGAWTSWGGCLGTCGIGSQTRTRLCNNPAPANGGYYCYGSGTESQSCNTGITCPPVNGNWGGWNSWNVCSATCGNGYQTRTRQCNNPKPSNGGSDCSGSGTETQSCYTGVTCPPVNGNWGAWISWSGCSETCGSGSQTRTRLCNDPAPSNGGSVCGGSGTESQSCDSGVTCPPVNGNWGYWTSWGGCSTTCANGTQSRTRHCNNPAPSNGGSDCSGSGTESQSCNTGVTCPPVNGNWGGWTSWSGCSATCANGSQTRTRLCNNPAPSNGGSYCTGFGSESQICNTGVSCPSVNGNWGEWISWSSCSVTCGDGAQFRTRLCNNPPPANKGSDCSGSGTESQICNTGVTCPPVNGNWGAWNSWSGCSMTCANGYQTRTRQCNNPPPINGGYECSGSGTESQICNTGVTCPPVNGNWEDWTSCSECSVTCGDGLQKRTRLCDNPVPAYGGSHCSGSIAESKKCSAGIVCPDLSSTPKETPLTVIIVGIVAFVVILSAVVGFCICLRRKRKRSSSSKENVTNSSDCSRHVYENEISSTDNPYLTLEQINGDILRTNRNYDNVLYTKEVMKDNQDYWDINQESR